MASTYRVARSRRARFSVAAAHAPLHRAGRCARKFAPPSGCCGTMVNKMDHLSAKWAHDPVRAALEKKAAAEAKQANREKAAETDVGAAEEAAGVEAVRGRRVGARGGVAAAVVGGGLG